MPYVSVASGVAEVDLAIDKISYYIILISSLDKYSNQVIDLILYFISL